MTRKMRWSAVCSLALLGLLAGCRTTRRGAGVGKVELSTWGIEYSLQVLTEPRPNRVHVLRVDLARRRVVPVVVYGPDPDGNGPGEVALTNPLSLAQDPRTLAFVNTNPWDSFPDAAGQRNRAWFEGQVVDIVGLAASAGQLRSQPAGVSVWIDTKGRVRIGENPDPSTVAEGMAGFNHIVKDGAIVVGPDEVRHPRTAIGTDSSGRVLWLVVVDGRQKGYSEGMSIYELAEVMLKLGCQEAANMDGGGSSIMGLAGTDGQLQVMNRPSDLAAGPRRIRPLPTILAIRRKE